jgi:hypothetical protein
MAQKKVTSYVKETKASNPAPDPTEIITTEIDGISNQLPVKVPKGTENSLVVRARLFVIKTKEDCELAIDIRSRIKSGRNHVKELFGKMVDAAHQAHVEAKAVYNRYDEPLNIADDIFKDKVKDYVRAQERIKQEAQAKLQREADEQARLAAEEKKLALAQELADRGDIDAAADVINEVAVMEPAKKIKFVNEDLPKVDKRLIRDKWIGRVDSLKLLIDAVAAGIVPINALEPNQKFLDIQAKAFRDTDSLAYPGVVVVCE